MGVSTGTIMRAPGRQPRYVEAESHFSDAQALVSDITHARREFTHRGDPRRLVDLYDSYVRKNSDVRSAVEQRVSGLAARPVVFGVSEEAPDDEEAKRHSRLLQRQWRRMKGGRIIQHLVRSARLYGVGAAELEWRATVDGFLPVNLWTVGTKSLMYATVENHGGAQPGDWLLRQSGYGTGAPLIPGKWIICTPNPECPVGDRSLMSTSIFDAVFGQSVLGSWTLNLERYGLPLPHVKVNDWTDDALVEFVRESVRRMGEDHVLITGTSDQVSIDFLDGAQGSRNSASDPHARFLDAVGDRVARLWLGGTLLQRTGHSGSYNQGAVHENSFLTLLEGDARMVEQALQDGLVETYGRLNEVPEELLPQVALQVRLDTPAAAATLAEQLARGRYGMNVAELSKVLGFQITERNA